MHKFLSQNKKTILFSIIGIAALIGFSDAIYLTITHYAGNSVTCSLINGCNLVLASSWATISGIPLSLLGVIYYGLILVGISLYFYIEEVLLLSLLLAVTTIGVVISLAFLYLQLFVIQAICEYCLLSLVSSLTVWGGILILIRRPGVIEEN